MNCDFCKLPAQDAQPLPCCHDLVGHLDCTPNPRCSKCNSDVRNYVSPRKWRHYRYCGACRTSILHDDVFIVMPCICDTWMHLSCALHPATKYKCDCMREYDTLKPPPTLRDAHIGMDEYDNRNTTFRAKCAEIEHTLEKFTHMAETDMCIVEDYKNDGVNCIQEIVDVNDEEAEAIESWISNNQVFYNQLTGLLWEGNSIGIEGVRSLLSRFSSPVAFSWKVPNVTIHQRAFLLSAVNISAPDAFVTQGRPLNDFGFNHHSGMKMSGDMDAATLLPCGEVLALVDEKLQWSRGVWLQNKSSQDALLKLITGNPVRMRCDGTGTVYVTTPTETGVFHNGCAAYVMTNNILLALTPAGTHLMFNKSTQNQFAIINTHQQAMFFLNMDKNNNLQACSGFEMDGEFDCSDCRFAISDPVLRPDDAFITLLTVHKLSINMLFVIEIYQDKKTTRAKFIRAIPQQASSHVLVSYNAKYILAFHPNEIEMFCHPVMYDMERETFSAQTDVPCETAFECIDDAQWAANHTSVLLTTGKRTLLLM